MTDRTEEATLDGETLGVGSVESRIAEAAPSIAAPAPATSMSSLVSSFDWSATPLGPKEHWPPSLRSVVHIVLTSRFAMWMGWGPELTFLYNDAYARMTLGKKHPWALGRPSSEVWAEIWKDIGPRIASVLETGKATWDEELLLFLERSGFPEETYHTFSYSPLTDDSGALVGNLCVVTEETDRIVGDRRLASLRDLAAQLTATTSEEAVFAATARVLGANDKDLPFTLTYLFDEVGQATLVSRTGIGADHPAAPSRIAMSDASSWPAASLYERAAPILVEDAGERLGPLPAGAWDTPPRQALMVPISRPGQERPAGFLVIGVNPYRPLGDAYSGFVTLLAGQIASSLANVRGYAEARARAEALAELDRAKTEFFSNVSHEFRTPLTLMIGPTEDLLADASQPLAPPQREQLALVHRNELRLLKLVNALLDFSRIEAGRMQASIEREDLAALTTDVASTFRSAIEKAGLRFDVDCPPWPADRAPAYVDRDLWEKIVLNLLSNAFKHTFAGAITVRLRARDAHAELTVRDTGIGISADQLPHVFERFHRVPNARSRTHEGAGIGLALVRELVRLHGGSVSAESDTGRGTAFTVTLPLGSQHLPEDRMGRRAVEASGATSQTGIAHLEEALRWDDRSVSMTDAAVSLEPSRMGSGPRVLLAEDNADMRDYATRLLRDAGFAVEAVGDGVAALASVRRNTPDMVLTDVMMPQRDGFALLAALRGDPATAEIPVVMLSARAGEEARVEGFAAGADDYLVKPFSARELVARVRATVQLARLRKDAAAARRRGQEAEAAVAVSEEKYRSLFETMEQGYCLSELVRDEQGRAIDFLMLELNPAFERLIGLPVAQVRGRNASEVFPALEPWWVDAYERVIRDGRPERLEQEFKELGRWFEVHVYPRGGDHFALLFNDITERRQMDERLRESEARQAYLLKLSDAMRPLEDPIQLEAEACRILGEHLVANHAYYVRIDEVTDVAVVERDHVGGGVASLVSEYPLAAFRWVAPLFKLGYPVVVPDIRTSELVPEADRGAMAAARVIAFVAVPLVKHGELVGALCVAESEPRQWSASEVALVQETAERLWAGVERARAEAAMRSAKQVAEAANSAKSDFLAAMSHELRTPLNGIAGHVQLIQLGIHGPVTPEQGMALDRIHRSEQHLLSLINDILNFAKLEAGRVEYELTDLPLAEVVADVSAIIEPQLAVKGITYRADVALDTMVRGDREKLRQVLLNLLSNAVKFTESGGRVWIDVSMDTDSMPGTVLLRVSDTGCGIPSEKHEAIFEPFVQLRRSLTQGGEGTGLGLSISRDLARGMGGELTVQSVEGDGATFTLVLPAGRSQGSAVRKQESGTAAAL